MNRRKLRISSAALAVAACATGPALARGRQVVFHIPAGTLDEALRVYARAVGVQILYRAELLAGRSFAGIDGAAEPDAALRTLLKGTGLVPQRPSANVIVLVEGEAAAAQEVPAAGARDADIVVTGTSIRGADPIAPVTTIGRRGLDQLGYATVADAVAALPGNFGGTGNAVATLTRADSTALNASLAPAANLRGLGSEATLTLFDGRRVAGSGGAGDFSDLSAVPTLAVERVEVLSDGASAIYGSDAVGGVVNVVLRHRVDGVGARLRVGTGTDGTQRSAIAGFVAGRVWSTGSATLSYEFEHRDALSSLDRGYASTGDLRPLGGSDRRTFLSFPATILAFDPSAGAYLPAFRVPTLPGGRQPTLADLVPGSNLSNPYAGQDLSPRVDRHAAYARVSQDAGGRLELFAEARYARREFGYRVPGASTIAFVTAANPYFLPVNGQPFSVFGYSFQPEAGPARASGRVSALATTAGLAWKPGGAWSVDAYATYSRERSGELLSNTLNAAALNEALGVTPDDPATSFTAARDGFFNPYGGNSPAVIDFITSGYTRTFRRSSVFEGLAKADGRAFRLPGGDMLLAFGASARRETFSAGGEQLSAGGVPTPFRPDDARRGVAAAFAEVRLPLFGRPNGRPGLRALEMSAAGRVERYDGFGTTANPKLAILYRPAGDLALRASWGTSFRAPALTEVNARRAIAPTSLPDAAGVYRPSIVVVGGNRDLGPETATTWTGGLSLTPAAIPGLSLRMDAFSTRFHDRIGQPALQDVLRALTNPALSPFVRRISPGTSATDLAQVRALLAEPGAGQAFDPPTAYVAIVDGRYVNTSTLAVSGLDWQFTLGRAFGRDRFDLEASGTWLFDYSERLTAASAVVDRLDKVSNPVSLKVRGVVAWTRGAVSAALVGNYVDGYVDDAAAVARRIGSFATVDVTLGFTQRRGPLAGTRLGLVVDNAFDRDPPFVDRLNGIGFDAASANPFGRTVALEISRPL